METNWKDLEQGSIRELIRERVEIISEIFSRKVTDKMIMVFQEALKGYTYETIKQAFTKAERDLDRFPSPKAMRIFCNEFMPSQAWKYDYEPRLGKDPETGKPVRMLIDPDPLPGRSKELYRPQDCPEGREFLATLRKIAEK